MKSRLTVMTIYIIMGSLSSIVLGFLFFGQSVFNIRSPLFQFVSYGIVGSVSFALFRYQQFRDALFVNILLFAILYLLSGSRYFVTHLVYYIAVVSAVFIHSQLIYTKMQPLKYARPFVPAALFSMFFVCATLLLYLLYSSPKTNLLPFRNMPVGFLTGLGLGAGFELAEIIHTKLAD